MKTWRPRRITIRLTEEEHQALSELRLVHGGSYQGVLMDALSIAYNLYDYAKAIRQQREQQPTLPLLGTEPDVPWIAEENHCPVCGEIHHTMAECPV